MKNFVSFLFAVSNYLLLLHCQSKTTATKINKLTTKRQRKMENTEKNCRLRIDYHWQLSQGCGEDCAPIIDETFDNVWVARTKMKEVMPCGYDFDDGDDFDEWDETAEPFAQFISYVDRNDRYILATLEPVSY